MEARLRHLWALQRCAGHELAVLVQLSTTAAAVRAPRAAAIQAAAVDTQGCHYVLQVTPRQGGEYARESRCVCLYTALRRISDTAQGQMKFQWRDTQGSNW